MRHEGVALHVEGRAQERIVPPRIEVAERRLNVRRALHQTLHRLRRVDRHIAEVINDILVVRGDLRRQRRRDVVHLLVAPHHPADVVGLQAAREFVQPRIRILAALRHDQRHVVLVRHIDKRLDRRLRRRAPVAVEAQRHVGIPRRHQAGKRTGELVALDHDDVIRVHRADRRRDLHQQRAQIVRGRAGRQPRLVHQLVTEDRGLILVAVRDRLPDVRHALLVERRSAAGRRIVVRVQRPQTGHAGLQPVRDRAAVIPVRPFRIRRPVVRLAARASVHVENNGHVVRLAPRHHLVHHRKALGAVHAGRRRRAEQPVVEGKTNRVEPLDRKTRHVRLRQKVGRERIPERRRVRLAHDLLDARPDARVRADVARMHRIEPQRIRFRVVPMAQIITLDEEWLPIRIQNARSGTPIEP